MFGAKPSARNTPGLTKRRQTPRAAATFGVLTDLAGWRPPGPGANGSLMTGQRPGNYEQIDGRTHGTGDAGLGTRSVQCLGKL